MKGAEKLSLYVKILLIIAAVSLALALLSSFTRYIFAKDYYFFVEAACDPETELCFVRSCDDYCPPNELETYKTYTIRAADFDKCSDNSCQNICETNETRSMCTEVLCDVEIGDECTG